MKYCCIALLVFIASACANLEPVSVSSRDLSIQDRLSFKAPVEKTIGAAKEAIAKQGWKLLYEGTTLPTGDFSTLSNTSHNPFTLKSMSEQARTADSKAWDQSLESKRAPKYFMQVKTPTSAFSYVAEIFITVFEVEASGSAVVTTASTGQALEKGKLGKYLSDFAQSLSELNE